MRDGGREPSAWTPAQRSGNHGYPDGFAVDKRGWLWTTAGDGIHVYAPDGTKLGFIATPATPSNCCFGLADMSRFFVANQKYLWAIDFPGEAK